MEKFDVHILGCGSAIPTGRHLPTTQVVNFRDKLFMIDCGEGAQLQFRKQRLKFSRLVSVFISHLHGDHCFGLVGIISTMNLLGRTAQLHLYLPLGGTEVLKPVIDYFNREMTYEVVYHEHDTRKQEVIYEDRSLTVETIPLCHRIPCCGFLFKEKPNPRHINREMVDFWKVPLYELERLRRGEDFVTPDGTVVPNERLTKPADPSRTYAYCSDTAFHPAVAAQVLGVDVLYHEATFGEDNRNRAKETFHSTARDAAEIARRARVKKLVIGHFSARYEDESSLLREAEEVFPQTVLAKESLVVSVG